MGKAIAAYEKDLQQYRDAVVAGERQAAKQQQEAQNWQHQVEVLRDRFSQGVQALRDRVVAAGFESVKACRSMQAAVGQIPELEPRSSRYRASWTRKKRPSAASTGPTWQQPARR